MTTATTPLRLRRITDRLYVTYNHEHQVLQFTTDALLPDRDEYWGWIATGQRPFPARAFLTLEDARLDLACELGRSRHTRPTPITRPGPPRTWPTQPLPTVQVDNTCEGLLNAWPRPNVPCPTLPPRQMDPDALALAQENWWYWTGSEWVQVMPRRYSTGLGSDLAVGIGHNWRLCHPGQLSLPALQRLRYHRWHWDRTLSAAHYDHSAPADWMGAWSSS